MIFVDRSRVPVPEILLSDRAKKARAEARAYFSVPREKRLQTRFEFDPTFWRQSVDELTKLFRQKCAYCETPYVQTSAPYLDHFRPKALATGLPGDSAKNYGASRTDLPDGYWWLAYEWENLYCVCQICNHNKRDTFPVRGHRARPETTGDGLLKESPLLLDPCWDNSETFFQFDNNGHIMPNSELASDSEPAHRAQVTIQVLGLNRTDLIQRRSESAKEVRAALKSVPTPDFSLVDHPLVRLLHPEQPFLALRRALVREWALKAHQQIPTRLRVPFTANLTQSLNQLNQFLTSRESAIATNEILSALGTKEQETREKPNVKVSTDRAELLKRPWKKTLPDKGTPQTLNRGGYIQSIEIENFKAIERLKIEFPTGTADRVGWKVLLGENGTGKSSVLQAVALTLLGEKASKFAYRPDRMLRKLPGSGGLAGDGFVRVRLSSAPEPVEMHFSRKGITFTQPSALPVDLVLRGYGPTRLMPRRGRWHGPRLSKSASRLSSRNEAGNLFDPFLPVCDANTWLNGLKSKEAFASAALSLKDLLRIPEKTWLHREKGSVIVPLDGLKITLDELSAGYESVLVLAVDIMSAVHGSVHDMRQAAGIVLLDEIDAHLHPRWKMEIVGALRRSFPLIQFLATTHEPLCLRGIEDGEVTVMRRVGSLIVLEDELPSFTGLRVDQLLTSQFFGLHSTIEPELDNKFVEYYSLLAKHDAELSPGQRGRLEELKRELSGIGVLGHTRRDQIIYEVIDEYLAKEPLLASKEERPVLRAETKRRIAKLLTEVSTEASS